MWRWWRMVKLRYSPRQKHKQIQGELWAGKKKLKKWQLTITKRLTASPAATLKLWGYLQSLQSSFMKSSPRSLTLTGLPLPPRGRTSLPTSSALTFPSPFISCCTTVAIKTLDPTRQLGYPTRKYYLIPFSLFQLFLHYCEFCHILNFCMYWMIACQVIFW